MRITFDPETEESQLRYLIDAGDYRRAWSEMAMWLKTETKHRDHHRHVAKVLWAVRNKMYEIAREQELE